jgi:Tfp pilus assembly protein PilV
MARERGSVLLAVLVLGLGLVALAAMLSEVVRQAVLEHGARRDALCARYAALSALAAGPDRIELARGATDADAVTVFRRLRSPSWCVLRSHARCGRAVRTVDRTLADPRSCLAPLGSD